MSACQTARARLDPQHLRLHRARARGRRLLDAALAYVKQREQFGKPLAGFQLIQNRLARMLAEVTSMQLYCFRIAPPGRGGARDRHDRRARQDEQHPQGGLQR